VAGGGCARGDNVEKSDASDHHQSQRYMAALVVFRTNGRCQDASDAQNARTARFSSTDRCVALMTSRGWGNDGQGKAVPTR
jgi:hypothetical protein